MQYFIPFFAVVDSGLSNTSVRCDAVTAMALPASSHGSSAWRHASSARILRSTMEVRPAWSCPAEVVGVVRI